MLLLRRAEQVGSAFAEDPKAGHVFGRMDLAGLLVDPRLDPRSDDGREQSRRRYEAGLKYAAEHLVLFGTGTAPSHLRNLITGMGMQSQDSRDDNRLVVLTARHNQKYADAMTTPPAGRLLGHHVLERCVLQETGVENPRDQETLRRVLDRIGAAKRQERFHEGHPELERGVETTLNCKPIESHARPRRQRGLPVEFHTGQVERSDAEKAAIAAAVAKLMAMPAQGGAD